MTLMNQQDYNAAATSKEQAELAKEQKLAEVRSIRRTIKALSDEMAEFNSRTSKDSSERKRSPRK